MRRKYLFPVIALLAIIMLFTLYKREQSGYKKMLQANYALNARLKELEESNRQVTQTIAQVTGRQDVAQQEHATFIDQKKYYRINWKNYIHISTNDYRTGFLGGIHDLQINVNNETEFSLDNVVINVQYLKPGGEVFKTETISISGIPAKNSRSVPAPDSRRGMSIKWQLQRVTSQEMNFCYSRDKTVSPGDRDPYQCVAAPLKQ